MIYDKYVSSTFAYFLTNVVNLMYFIKSHTSDGVKKLNVNKITGSLTNKYFVLMFYSITVSRMILSIS